MNKDEMKYSVKNEEESQQNEENLGITHIYYIYIFTCYITLYFKYQFPRHNKIQYRQ